MDEPYPPWMNVFAQQLDSQNYDLGESLDSITSRLDELIVKLEDIVYTNNSKESSDLDETE